MKTGAMKKFSLNFWFPVFILVKQHPEFSLADARKFSSFRFSVKEPTGSLVETEMVRGFVVVSSNIFFDQDVFGFGSWFAVAVILALPNLWVFIRSTISWGHVSHKMSQLDTCIPILLGSTVSEFSSLYVSISFAVVKDLLGKRRMCDRTGPFSHSVRQGSLFLSSWCHIYNYWIWKFPLMYPFDGN